MFCHERDILLRGQIADRTVRIVTRLVRTYPSSAWVAQENQARLRPTIVLVDLAEPILQVTAVTPGFRRARLEQANLHAIHSCGIGIRRARDSARVPIH